MRTRAHRRLPQALILLALAALVVGVSTASPANQTINLCATDGTVTVPGHGPIDIWGFVGGTAADCSGLAHTATVPGPELRVDKGDAVTLNVTNLLSDRAISLEIPGVHLDGGTVDVDSNATVSRTFTASDPGTYLYQSVGDGERQTAMGLYGALIVNSGTANQAYDSAGAYDVDAPLVLSAIDPSFNADPDGFDMRDYLATYWLIDGKAYPDTSVIHFGDNGTAGRRVLLRYLNAGHDNTTMMLLGVDERVIARDAHVLPNAFTAHAETIPAGETEDVVVTVPAGTTVPSGLTHGFPLYNRQLHLGNGSPSASPGGMMTFIRP